MRLHSAALSLRARLPRRLPREPWNVLLLLVLLQWGALIAFVETVRHHGWLFYQGGDETFFYTSSWVVSHGHIPVSEIGFAWPYLTAPLDWIFGSNVLAALPAIILLQVLILLPLSTLAIYGVGARLGGRVIGYVAAVCWVLGPYASIPLWDHRYHAKYVEQFLPQALGLTGLGDFPSTVCLLVAALFFLRALDGRGSGDMLLAGVATGFAIGIKPANALFLAGAALALVGSRRWRESATFAAALAPALLALTLWKLKGLGYLPIVTKQQSAYAAGSSQQLPSLPLGLVFSKYSHFSWPRLEGNYLQLREFFWSVRLVQWIPLAGALAIARRSWPKTLFLAGWLGAFVLVKGSSPAARIEDGSFLRLFMPGLPPFVLLMAAIPLLWPRTGVRLADRFPWRRPALGWRARSVVAAAVIFAAVPLAVSAALPPLHRHTVATYYGENVFVPVDRFGLSASAAPNGAVSLVWPAQPGSARAFYRVFRMQTVQLAPRQAVPPPAYDGIRCVPKKGAQHCTFEMDPLASMRGTEYVDRPPKGRWSYRVAMVANWVNDLERGDILQVSTPVRVRVQ